MVSIGEKIQALRIFRGITQDELAEGLVSRSMISQIVTNRTYPSNDLLIKLVNRLNYPMLQFLSEVHLPFSFTQIFKLANDLVEHQEHQAALFLIEHIEQEAPENLITPSEKNFVKALCLKDSGRVEEAVDLLDHLLGLSLQDNLRAQILYHLADCYFRLHKLPSAELYAKEADRVATKLDDFDKYSRARIKNLLGMLCTRFGKYQESILHFTEAEIYYHSQHPSLAATMIMNCGVSYKVLNEYTKAMECYEKSLSAFQKLPVDKNSILARYNHSILLSLTQNYHAAASGFNQCLIDMRKHNLKHMIPLIYTELARLEMNKGNVSLALAHAAEGLQMTDAHEERGHLHQIIGQIQMKAERFQEAIIAFEESIRYFKQFASYANIIQSLSFISKCYKTLGNIEKAIEVLEKSKEFVYNG